MDESAQKIEEPAPEGDGASEDREPGDTTESHLRESVPDTTDENDRPVDNPSG